MPTLRRTLSRYLRTGAVRVRGGRSHYLARRDLRDALRRLIRVSRAFRMLARKRSAGCRRRLGSSGDRGGWLAATRLVILWP